MASTKTLDEPTPHGGVRSEIIYLDRTTNKAVDESVATACEIIEYDAHGEQVFRTYGYINQ